MFWILLVIIAQAVNAVVTLIDKDLVTTKKIERPVTYAFYVGLMSIAVIFILPLGWISLPDLRVVYLSLLSGVIYVFALLFLYKSLKISEASDVSPVIAAITALASFGLAPIFLNDPGSPSGALLIGFVLLIAGTFVMSYFRFSMRSLVFLMISGVLFGASSVFTKDLFMVTNFWNGFFWSRMANVVGVLLFLLIPSNRAAIFGNMVSSSGGTKLTVVLNKIIAGAAFLLILYAIKLGNVAVVNALAGVQFAFLLIASLFLSKKFPEYIHETIKNKKVLAQKLLATATIIVGLVFLFSK